MTRTSLERWWAIQKVIVSSTPLRIDIGTILLRQGKDGDLAVHLQPVHPIVAKTAEGAEAQNGRHRGHVNSTVRTGRWTEPTCENYLDPDRLILLETTNFEDLGLLVDSHHLHTIDCQTRISHPATVDAHRLLVTAAFLVEDLLHQIGVLILVISTNLDELLRLTDPTKIQREQDLAGQIHAHQEKKLEHIGDRHL